MAYKPSFEQRGTTSEPGQFREESDSLGNAQAFPIGTIVSLADNGDIRFPEVVTVKTIESTLTLGTSEFVKSLASEVQVSNLNVAQFRLLKRATADSTISNTVAETNFSPVYLVPADEMIVGMVYRIKVRGVISTV